MWDKLKKTGKFPHVARWHEFIGTQTPMQDVAQQYDTKAQASCNGQGSCGLGLHYCYCWR